MNTWKILGGAVLGIAAVAAAPMTGGGSLLGATSLAASLAGAGVTATGAAVAGAVVGASLENEDENKLEKQNEENKKKVDDFKESFNGFAKGFDSKEKAYNSIIAMVAVGIAAANSDENISEEEMQMIKKEVIDKLYSKIPDNIKSKIDSFIGNPPSIEKAFIYVQKANYNKDYTIYDNIINLVINADGKEHVKEKEFKEAWESLKKD